VGDRKSSIFGTKKRAAQKAQHIFSGGERTKKRVKPELPAQQEKWIRKTKIKSALGKNGKKKSIDSIKMAKTHMTKKKKRKRKGERTRCSQYGSSSVVEAE